MSTHLPPTVDVFGPCQDSKTAPINTIPRQEARELRDAGLGVFINRARGIRLETLRLPQAQRRKTLGMPRTRQFGACKTCGGGSFQRICPCCRQGPRMFGAKWSRE